MSQPPRPVKTGTKPELLARGTRPPVRNTDCPVIRLSPEECASAAVKGAIQVARAIDMELIGHDHGSCSGRDKKERWANGQHGFMGEEVFAKYINQYPRASVEGITGVDAGYNVQVRTTVWDDGCLIVNRAEIEDYAGQQFVLITGHYLLFTIRGWLNCADAARPQWFKGDEDPASYWVPQANLHPMTTFKL